MKIVNNPPESSWKQLCERPQLALDALDTSVRNIIRQVRDSGDQALIELTLQFDNTQLSRIRVPPEEIASAERLLNEGLLPSMRTAARNIEQFHQAQKRETMTVETMPGVLCWRKAVPIDKIGIYVPGGSAPLFSTVLMLGIPAKLAGCREVILCTPPDKTGRVNPAILFAAKLVGIKKIFGIGGAQAIAAMAYGTETIPQVYKIFGPGNQFVTKAKQIVSEDGLAIDMPAGPSELLILADRHAEPVFIAADLLSQAEHGEDSQVVLVVDSNVNIERIQQEIESQLAQLPRRAIAVKALANSSIFSFDSEERAIHFINAYAPEHLIINTQNADAVAESVVNAGSVFIGGFSPEAAGDYASGTNHTLPTNGYARAYAGVSLESFLKFITFQKITADGLKILGPAVEKMAEAEFLVGHKMAVSKRLEYLNKK
jgi:histidinol dehydrogenase